MKPILTLALLLSAATARGQVDFGSVCTPAQRVEALKAAFAKAKPGDTLNVPEGVYEAYDFPRLPDGVKVIGAGWGKTVFRSARPLLVDRPNIPDQAVTFELGNDCWLQDVTLDPTAAADKQTAVVGYGTPSATPRSATLYRVQTTRGVWPVYSWFGIGNSITIDACQINGARVGITGGVSSGAGAQTITITGNTIVNLNTALSTYGVPWDGESVSHPQWGGTCNILIRGGLLRLIAKRKQKPDGTWEVEPACTLTSSGPPPGTGNRCVAISDWLNLSSATQTVIELDAFRTKLTANGAKEVFDVDVRYGSWKWASAFGSGKGGGIAFSNLPPLKPEGTK